MYSLNLLSSIKSPEEMEQLFRSDKIDPVDNSEIALLKSLWEKGTDQEKEMLINLIYKFIKENKVEENNLSFKDKINKGLGRVLMLFAILKTGYRSFYKVTNAFYKIAERTNPQRKPNKK